MKNSMIVGACLLVGGLLPLLLGEVLSDHKCVYDIDGCGDDYGCSVDSGHCAGNSVRKTGQHIVSGACHSRPGSSCSTVANQPCHQEVYHSDDDCTVLCDQYTTTIALGCNSGA